MCSSQTKIKCPICNEYIDQNRNRIIVELCGHSKCRQCFITEVNGCVLCHRDNERPTGKNSIAQTDDGTDLLDGPAELSTVGVDAPDADLSSCEGDILPVQHDNGSTAANKIEILENVLVIAQSPPIPSVLSLPPPIISPPNTNDESTEGSIIEKPKTGTATRTTMTTSTPSHIEVIKINNEISFKCRICQKQFKSRKKFKFFVLCRQLTARTQLYIPGYLYINLHHSCILLSTRKTFFL